MKTLCVALLFIGEAGSIVAEMLAAYEHGNASASFTASFARALPWITVAGACLVAAYIVGYAAFRNIWTVTAISIAGILLVEPVAAVLLFREVPTRGAVVGFGLGAIGLLATLID